jgi:hypothetical protein
MEDTEYAAAYGFESSLVDIWQSAHAYRSLKLFRLARLRHQSMYQSSRTPSLASLPIEVFRLIEGIIIEDALDDALEDLPENNCQCKGLFNGFMELHTTKAAFTRFSEYWNLSEDGDMAELSECILAFAQTDVFGALYHVYEQRHLEDCEDGSAGDKFWESVSCHLWDETHTDANGLIKVYAHSFTIGSLHELSTILLQSRIGGGLHELLRDHGLNTCDFDDECAFTTESTVVYPVSTLPHDLFLQACWTGTMYIWSLARLKHGGPRGNFTTHRLSLGIKHKSNKNSLTLVFCLA